MFGGSLFFKWKIVVDIEEVLDLINNPECNVSASALFLSETIHYLGLLNQA